MSDLTKIVKGIKDSLPHESKKSIKKLHVPNKREIIGNGKFSGIDREMDRAASKTVGGLVDLTLSSVGLENSVKSKVTHKERKIVNRVKDELEQSRKNMEEALRLEIKRKLEIKEKLLSLQKKC